MRPDAVMLTEPKGKMRIPLAVDPELVRLSENSLVTIGGIEKQRHGLAGADRLAAEFDVLRRSADDVPARRRPAQHFLDGGIDQGRVGA